MENKILYSGFRDENHSSAGGYDKIINYPNSKYVCDKDVFGGNIKVGTRGKVLNLLCLDILTRIKRYKFSITHIFYGDTIIFPYRKSSKHKLVATIHLDVAKRKRLPNLFLKALKTMDGVIVLSSQQQKELQINYGVHATFIPHGFLRPKFSFKNPIDWNERHFSDHVNVFYSGVNYRDVNLLIRTVEDCDSRHLNICFHLVGQTEETKRKMSNYGNVVCYKRLSDDEYFSVLSSCDYNFLPLTFATANNALLEAEFLGVMGILPNIPGIEDYAAPFPLNVFYNSEKELFSLLGNLQKREASVDLIRFAKQFQWENIYKLLDKFYNEL